MWSSSKRLGRIWTNFQGPGGVLAAWIRIFPSDWVRPSGAFPSRGARDPFATTVYLEWSRCVRPSVGFSGRVSAKDKKLIGGMEITGQGSIISGDMKNDMYATPTPRSDRARACCLLYEPESLTLSIPYLLPAIFHFRPVGRLLARAPLECHWQHSVRRRCRS